MKTNKGRCRNCFFYDLTYKKCKCNVELKSFKDCIRILSESLRDFQDFFTKSETARREKMRDFESKMAQISADVNRGCFRYYGDWGKTVK